MFRDSLAIEKVPARIHPLGASHRWGHIFYESDNEGFIVRCITDLSRATRPRVRVV